MKKLLFVIVLIVFVSISNAQSPSKGQAQLNLGVGLSGWGIPFYGGIDFGINRDFTVGGEISYQSYDENYNGYSYHHSITGIAGNVNYHFNRVLEIPKPFDFYAGLNLGFYAWSNPDNYPGNHSSGLGLGAQVGGRYNFTNKIGLNLEFGGGNESVGGKFGLTFRL